MNIALDILQWLICNETQPNQTKPNHQKSITSDESSLLSHFLQFVKGPVIAA